MPMKTRSAKSLLYHHLNGSTRTPSAKHAGVGPSPDAILRPILVQSELGPQVNPAHLVVGRQRLGRAALEDHAAMDDVRAIGDAEGFAHVVIGDQHADAARFEVKDDLLN